VLTNQRRFIFTNLHRVRPIRDKRPIRAWTPTLIFVEILIVGNILLNILRHYDMLRITYWMKWTVAIIVQPNSDCSMQPLTEITWTTWKLEAGRINCAWKDWSADRQTISVPAWCGLSPVHYNLCQVKLEFGSLCVRDTTSAERSVYAFTSHLQGQGVVT